MSVALGLDQNAGHALGYALGFDHGKWSAIGE